jgi:hypothetical protein
LPRLSHPSARPALEPRGPALPVAPPDEAASCPASCILRLCRRPSFELPRLSRPSAHSVVKFELPRPSLVRLRLSMRPPGCPGFCIFRPCRRWIFESPRISHPSAHPTPKLASCPAALLFRLRLSMSPRVAPVSASSGCAGDGSTSCPASRVLRRLWRWCFGLPLGIALPAAPPGGFASCPALRTFRLCLGFESSGCPDFSCPRLRLMVLRVASVPASSGFAVPASSGFPESCIYGWVNDDFPVLLELCILGLPADESSWSIGPYIFPTDSGCNLNFIQA